MATHCHGGIRSEQPIAKSKVVTQCSAKVIERQNSLQ